jgi:hypothetical protein
LADRLRRRSLQEKFKSPLAEALSGAHGEEEKPKSTGRSACATWIAGTRVCGIGLVDEVGGVDQVDALGFGLGEELA